VAAAWWQSHPTDTTCNGSWQTQKFTIDTSEVNPFTGGTIGYGSLQKGVAYVQFCLISEEQGLFLIDQRWIKVA